MQYDIFIRQRLTELRLKKNVSEYRMSLDLGHSNSYIRNITSGKALPSMCEFLYICEYLGITPMQFFNEENTNPILINRLMDLAQKMNDDDLYALIDMAERINK